MTSSILYLLLSIIAFTEHLTKCQALFGCWGFGSGEERGRPCPHVVGTFILVGDNYVNDYVNQ